METIAWLSFSQPVNTGQRSVARTQAIDSGWPGKSRRRVIIAKNLP